MALQVVTNDASALTDTDLDELATIDGAFDIGVLSKAKEEWVLDHHRSDRRQVARIHVLHARTHRGHTVRADRADERSPLVEARDRAARPDERGLPPSADGVPRRGRGGRIAIRHRRRRSAAFKELIDVTPSPGSNAVGEERAWGRRLAKRFNVDADYDARTLHRQEGRPGRLRRSRAGQARRRRPRRHGRCSTTSRPTPAA